MHEMSGGGIIEARDAGQGRMHITERLAPTSGRSLLRAR